MRVLYEAELTGDRPAEVLELAFGRFRFTEEGRAYAARLVNDYVTHRRRVDRVLSDALEHWELERLGAVDRAILRLATVEALYLLETPGPVLLDEALRLAHRYGDPRSPAFINGVLDPIVRRARPKEPPRAAAEGA